jgi:hypothetical protein
MPPLEVEPRRISFDRLQRERHAERSDHRQGERCTLAPRSAHERQTHEREHKPPPDPRRRLRYPGVQIAERTHDLVRDRRSQVERCGNALGAERRLERRAMRDTPREVSQDSQHDRDPGEARGARRRTGSGADR